MKSRVRGSFQRVDCEEERAREKKAAVLRCQLVCAQAVRTSTCAMETFKFRAGPFFLFIESSPLWLIFEVFCACSSTRSVGGVVLVLNRWEGQGRLPPKIAPIVVQESGPYGRYSSQSVGVYRHSTYWYPRHGHSLPGGVCCLTECRISALYEELENAMCIIWTLKTSSEKSCCTWTAVVVELRVMHPSSEHRKVIL